MPLKIGDKHGFLTAKQRLGPSAPRKGYNWLFQCDCGGELVCRADRVMSGNTVGCAECRSARISEKSRHHGACAHYETTRLYSIWRAMRFRCRAPTHRSFHNYGGKGIKVCDAWQAFPVFRDWALSHGYADNLTIDRLSSAKNYQPDNCEWVTRAENARRAMATRTIKKLPKGARLVDMENVAHG